MESVFGVSCVAILKGDTKVRDGFVFYRLLLEMVGLELGRLGSCESPKNSWKL